MKFLFIVLLAIPVLANTDSLNSKFLDGTDTNFQVHIARDNNTLKSSQRVLAQKAALDVARLSMSNQEASTARVVDVECLYECANIRVSVRSLAMSENNEDFIAQIRIRHMMVEISDDPSQLNLIKSVKQEKIEVENTKY